MELVDNNLTTVFIEALGEKSPDVIIVKNEDIFEPPHEILIKEESQNEDFLVKEEGVPTVESYLSLDSDLDEGEEAMMEPLWHCQELAGIHNVFGQVKVGRQEQSALQGNSFKDRSSKARPLKVDKDDPRSRLHYIKFMKKDGRRIKKWECGICGKEFLHQYSLMRHLPTHTDVRNYHCSACGKNFRQLSTLTQHKAIHSQERPYVCEVCTKSFSRVSALISHKKLHSDVKQHVCRECGKGFHQKGNLKNHYYTHTNARPYKCDICNKGFNQLSNLHCHKVKAHVNSFSSSTDRAAKFKCRHCSLTFVRKVHLQNHERRVHDFMESGVTCQNDFPLGFDDNSELNSKKLSNVCFIQLVDENDTLKQPQVEFPQQGIFINPIETKAMQRTLARGQSPFALLKPSRGKPVVVKVLISQDSKHMLVPATAGEIRSIGKIVICDGSKKKAVQIKVPVVATLVQKLDENGHMSFDVEPPGDEKDAESDPLSLDTFTGDQDNLDELPFPPSSDLSMNSLLPTALQGDDDPTHLPTTLCTDGFPSSNVGMQYDFQQAPSDIEGTLTSVDVPLHSSLGLEKVQFLRNSENLEQCEIVPDSTVFATHIITEDGNIQQIRPNMPPLMMNVLEGGTCHIGSDDLSLENSVRFECN